jgi:hypothetical protein
MNRSNANVRDNPIHIAALAIAAIVCFAAPVAANNGGGGQQQNTTANPAGGATQPGGGLNPDQAFAGGVQRTGAVGQATGGAVGASATSQAAGAAGAAGGRAGGALGGGLGGGGFGAAFNSLFNNNNTGGNSSTPALRTRLRSAVELPPQNTFSVQSRQVSANQVFQNVSSVQPYSGAVDGYPVNPYQGVNVQVQGTTAVLQGTVGSESARRMSTLLMRLEPGVSQVQNRLMLQP